MNLTRLLRMSPAEITTRAQQAFAKRWSKPPACRLIPSDAAPCFPDLPPPDSLASAEKICRHRFDLLGYTDLDFGSPIDWHFDPVHQKRAPRRPWYQIPFLDFDQVGDHKIIWELNRHQHLVTLARAGFHDEIVAQWTGWQNREPLPYWHQLGQLAGSRVSGALLALGPQHHRRFSSGPDPRPPPSRLVHRALSVDLLLTQHPPVR